jgi:WD40 repeat protein
MNSVEGCEEMAHFTHEKRVTCMATTSHQDHGLITATENGSIYGWDTDSGEETFVIKQAHASRIRGLTVLSTDEASTAAHMFATGSSDGVVKVWDLRRVSGSEDTK